MSCSAELIRRTGNRNEKKQTTRKKNSLSAHTILFQLSKAKWRLCRNQRENVFRKVNSNVEHDISRNSSTQKLHRTKCNVSFFHRDFDTWRAWLNVIPKCINALMRHLVSSKNGCVSNSKSRGVEVKAKLNHLAVCCKLSLAWFMIFHVTQSIHTFCDTCFANFFFSAFQAIAYSFSVSNLLSSFLFVVNGKYHSSAKAKSVRNETSTNMWLHAAVAESVEENFYF